MARLRKDETGNKYGKLTVIQFNAMNKNGDALWLCRCDCGKDSVVLGTSLRRRKGTKSCGCLLGQCNPAEILSTRINETGNKYGRLTVIKFDGMHKKQTSWQCHCECGETVVVRGSSLRSGNTKSCGCINKEGNPTHGKVYHPIYNAYHAARTRCTNPKQIHWDIYGGRGIKFLLGSFEGFYERMLPTWFKGASIGRIDPNGNYEYGNIKWETNAQQARGKRTNVWYTHNGETLIQSDWATRIGITAISLSERVQKWGIERALSTPKIYKGVARAQSSS